MPDIARSTMSCVYTYTIVLLSVALNGGTELYICQDIAFYVETKCKYEYLLTHEML